MTATTELEGMPAPSPETAGTWLDGAPAALALPTDHPRPTTLSAPPQRLELPLEPDLVAPLEAVAAQNGVELATVLLAAWQALLARTADERDLVLGVAGVGWADGEEVLVVRTSIDLDADLRTAVAATALALEAARSRGARPVPALVADLGLEPGAAKHPVFQVGAVGEGQDGDGPWPRSSKVPPDLVLSWRREDAGRLVLALRYAPELFEPATAARWAGHLKSLLRGAAGDPAAPVGRLPLLSAEETAQLDAWNATSHPHNAGAPLAERFWTQLAATPDAVAVEGPDGPVSYRVLADRAVHVAGLLRAAGVDSDVTVAVCAERSVEMVAGVLAVLMAGGAYVPVDPAYPTDRRDFMIGDSGARVLLTQTGLRHAVPDNFEGEVLLLDALPAAPDSVDETELRGRSGHDLGYVIYTSGSTGRPKAVAMPQSALDNLLAWQLRRPQFAPGARTLQFSSLSFDVSFQEIWSTWASGGTLVLVDDATRRDPLRLLQHLVEHRVQRLFLPNVALRGLASAVAATGRRPEHLREVYTAGEQLQVDAVMRSLFVALPDAVLENQYGPSESHVVTAHTLTGPAAGWPVLPPIGGPIDNSQVHVLDGRLERRPVGVPGELYLGGRCLARGYLGRPDLTEERFVSAPEWAPQGGPLYKTGDLARWLPSGDIEFLGRLDHQVKFRGYRIEPGEVGAVLSACPGVAQCVALVRALEAGPRLTAYVVPDEGGVDLGSVHRYAKDHLPGHMVPSHYLVVATLPLTASGKVDTAALPDAEFDRGILGTPHRAPSSRVERALADIWSTLLGIPDVGVDDDFFELGGDSLLAAEMAQRVADELDREMPLGALAQSPTIAGLARLLQDESGEAIRRSLVPLQPGDPGVTPLFVVHGGSGNVATFPKLARALDPSQPVYALQWNGFAGGNGARRVEAMAAHYLSEVRDVQPSGPYLLAGQCIGGLVARDMTRRLLSDGEQVELLVMYDSPNLASDAYVPGPTKLAELRAPGGVRKAAYEAARAVYRRRPWRNDPVGKGSEAMRAAARRHRPRSLPPTVETHFVGSGESQGSAIAMSGHWTDGVMGWSSSASATFQVHRLSGDHNHVLYQEDALDVLRDALRRAHARITGS